MKVRQRAKIRNRYNQEQHLTQDTNGKVTKSQLDITNEGQEVSTFPAGGHKALQPLIYLFGGETANHVNFMQYTHHAILAL